MEDKLVVFLDGKEVFCNVLYTLEDEKNNKRYVIYTIPIENNKKIHMRIINEKEKCLDEITDIKEKKELEKIIKIIKTSFRGEKDETK